MESQHNNIHNIHADLQHAGEFCRNGGLNGALQTSAAEDATGSTIAKQNGAHDPSKCVLNGASHLENIDSGRASVGKKDEAAGAVIWLICSNNALSSFSI